MQRLFVGRYAAETPMIRVVAGRGGRGKLSANENLHITLLVTAVNQRFVIVR